MHKAAPPDGWMGGTLFMAAIFFYQNRQIKSVVTRLSKMPTGFDTPTS